MKKILIFLSVIFLINCKGDNENNVIISVPATVSSIPLLELNKTTIGKKVINVEFYQDHIVAMTEFVNGKVDIVMTGFTQGVMNYKENKEIVQLFCPVWGVSSVVSNRSDVRTIDDLKGLKIAVPFQGSPLDMQLRYILNFKFGDNPVNIEYFPPQQAAGLLAAGKIDAICVPEPISSQLIFARCAKRVDTFANMWSAVNEGEPRSPQVSVFSSRKFISRNSDFIDELLIKLEDVMKSIKGDQAFIEKYSTIFDVNNVVLELSLINTLYDLPLPEDTAKLCNNYLEKIEYKNIPDREFYFHK